MLLYYFDLIGVAVFAASAVLAAQERDLDILGVIVVASITAIGGGTLRDLLGNRHPIFWITDQWYLIVILVSAVSTVAYARDAAAPARHPSRCRCVRIGAVGAIRCPIGGKRAECPPLIVVLMGTMTGVTGGVLRDVITARVPLILQRENYMPPPPLSGSRCI